MLWWCWCCEDGAATFRWLMTVLQCSRMEAQSNPLTACWTNPNVLYFEAPLFQLSVREYNSVFLSMWEDGKVGVQLRMLLGKTQSVDGFSANDLDRLYWLMMSQSCSLYADLSSHKLVSHEIHSSSTTEAELYCCFAQSIHLRTISSTSLIPFRVASISNHSRCSLPQPSQFLLTRLPASSRWINLSTRAMNGDFCMSDGLVSRSVGIFRGEELGEVCGLSSGDEVLWQG